jgi:hypothetical protein
MDKNIISSDAANDLLGKLIAERIPVLALLTAPSGSQTHVFGFVIENSVELGFKIVSSVPTTSKTDFINIPLRDVHTEVSFGDKREAPSHVRETLVPKFGDSTLIIRFLESGEFLVLIFTL